MEQARENWWLAYKDIRESATGHEAGTISRDVWNVAWAAAIAAFSYIQEGRLEP